MSATLSSSEQSTLEEIANLKKILDESGSALSSALGSFKQALDGALGKLKLTPDQQKLEDVKKAADEAKKKVEEQWKSLGDSISGALVKGISNLDDARKALHGAFGDFFKGIQSSVLDQLKALISPSISSVTSKVGSFLGGLFNPQEQSQSTATGLNTAYSPFISPVLGSFNPTNFSTAAPVGQGALSASEGASTTGALSSVAGGLGPYGMAAVAVYGVLKQFSNAEDAKTFKSTAAYRQQHQSIGSVLGDVDARSDSINKSITDLGANSKDLLDVNHGMYQALLDIKVGITGASAGISRILDRRRLVLGRDNVQGKPDDTFGIAGIKTGTSYSTIDHGGYLASKAAGLLSKIGLGGADRGLHGMISGLINNITSKINSAIYNKKVSVIDSGIQFNAQTLSDLLSGGHLNALSYAEVQTKRKVFGFTVSNKVNTKNGELDSLIAEQFSDVFRGAGDAIKEASKAFGVDFAELSTRLKIDPTKLSLKGLKGDDLSKAIEAFFSSTLDKWAGVLTDGTDVLKEFQKVGEGAFETVVRLASQVNIFSDYAQKLNLNFNLVGVEAIRASQAIAEYSGGFDALSTNLKSYYENYFTQRERDAEVTKKLKEEFDRLGLVMPKTKEEFKNLVSAQDGATAAGQKNIAMLLGLQDAFSKVFANKVTLEQLNKLDAFGGVFSRISSMSEDARDSLIELAGGIQSLLEKSQAFVDAYYSSDEKIGIKAKEILEKLKLAGVDNAGDFKSVEDIRALMEKLSKADLETEAGRKLFNTLLDIGPAFASIVDYLKTNNLTLGGAAQKGPVDDWFANYLVEQKKTTESTAQLASNQETTNTELAQINTALTDTQVNNTTALLDKQDLSNAHLASIDEGVRTGSSSVVTAINTAATAISDAVIRSMPTSAPASRAVTSA